MLTRTAIAWENVGRCTCVPHAPRPFQPCPDEYPLKKITLAAAVAVIAIGAAIWASPYYALHQMKTALDARDAAALAEHVDFPALRDNIKSQLAATMSRSLGALAGSDNPFAAMGAAVTNAMLGKMVDAMVSPAGVQALVSKSALSRQAPAGQVAGGSHDGTAGKARYAAGYGGWDRFVIRPAADSDDAGALVLRRHGLWSWKLSEVGLAQAMPAR